MSASTAKTVALSAQATDATGGGDLIYDWAVVSAPTGSYTPIFSNNDTNSAGAMLATLSQAGTYEFAVTVIGDSGSSIRSTVTVTIASVASNITISAPSQSIQSGQQGQFSAVVTDQFGNVISTPSLSWTADLGSINETSGLFTAPSTRRLRRRNSVGWVGEHFRHDPDRAASAVLGRKRRWNLEQYGGMEYKSNSRRNAGVVVERRYGGVFRQRRCYCL